MKKISMQLVKVKILLSVRTLMWFFMHVKYSAFGLLLSVLFFELIYWLFNIQLLATLLSSGSLRLSEKLALLLDPFLQLKQQNGVGTFILMMLLSLLQGMSVVVLVYAIKNQRRIDGKMVTGGFIVGFLAVIGIGCPACGTSLLVPLLATFVSGSAVALSEQVTFIALPLAIFVSTYGLYILGLRLANIKALTANSD